MLSVRYSSKFKRDFKACVKRGYNMPLLQIVIDTLRVPDALPVKNRDHTLSGEYKDFWECHILPDWLLIYKQTDTEVLLYRTGSHADLFTIKALSIDRQMGKQGLHRWLYIRQPPWYEQRRTIVRSGEYRADCGSALST